jgi:uncharacterized membrane protein YqiK
MITFNGGKNTMTEINPRVVGPGHNIPDFQKQESDRLAVDYVDLSTSVTEILDKARSEVPDEVTTDEELAIVNRTVVDMRDLTNRALTIHKSEKEPHLRRGQAGDQFFFGFRDRLKKAMDVIGGRGDAYNQKKIADERAKRERERLEAERVAREAREKLEAEQRAAQEAADRAARARKPENVEAHQAAADQHAAAAAGAREEFGAANAAAQDAAAAAVAKPADIARQRTEDGYMSTVKQVGYVEIVDAMKLDMATLWPFLKEDAILSALKSWAKTTNHKRKMEGAIVEMRNATVYR